MPGMCRELVQEAIPPQELALRLHSNVSSLARGFLKQHHQRAARQGTGTVALAGMTMSAAM